ncbi:hypothetical protein PQX77_017799 [Marasmius sp. AFHP31]|nr:hypothetical protein PQX77_017799 [Marasmius sp. AFHP31]
MPAVLRVRAQTPESSPLCQYPTRRCLSSIEEEATYKEGEYMYVGDQTWGGIDEDEDNISFAMRLDRGETTDGNAGEDIETQEEDQRQRQKGKKALKSRVTPKEVKNGDRKKTGNKPVEPLAGSGLAKKLKTKSRDREKATSTRRIGSNMKEPPTNAQVTTETPDGNLIDPQQSFREEESEDFEDNDKKFTGPLSDTGAARAVAAHKAYIAAMYDIAKEERKPAHNHVFAVVYDDDTPGTVQGVNPGMHGLLTMQRIWDLKNPKTEYVKHVEERKKKLNTNSVHKALAEEVSWFKNWFSSFWEDNTREGKFGGTLSKIIAPVMNILQAGSVKDQERLERKFFKVEQWIDAEQELPATQVGDVAIVTDVDGNFVITVNDVLSEFPDLELTDSEEIDIDTELSKSRSKSKSKSRTTKANPAAAVVRSPSPNVLLFYVNEESPRGRANQAHSPSPVQQQQSSVEPVEPLAIRVGRRLMKYVEIDNFASPVRKVTAVAPQVTQSSLFCCVHYGLTKWLS